MSASGRHLSARNPTPGAIADAAVAQSVPKTPRITGFFWAIVILTSALGETAADSLNAALGVSLSSTVVLFGALVVAAALAQFTAARYLPWVYWSMVVLFGAVGTLGLDLLAAQGVSLTITVCSLVVVTAAAMLGWTRSGSALSIGFVNSGPQERFYWLTMFSVFLLGTAGGDLIITELGLDGWPSAVLFGSWLAAIWLAAWGMGLNKFVMFWAGCAFCRPVGALLGDTLSRPAAAGGLDLPAAAVASAAAAVIFLIVVFLTLSRQDAHDTERAPHPRPSNSLRRNRQIP